MAFVPGDMVSVYAGYVATLTPQPGTVNITNNPIIGSVGRDVPCLVLAVHDGVSMVMVNDGRRIGWVWTYMFELVRGAG